MSCITVVGRHRYFGPECNVVLPRSLPEWTKSKMERLLLMMNDENPHVRAVAASHPKIKGLRLLKMLEDQSAIVRRAAVKNPNMTVTMLKLAAEDSDMGITAYARLLLEDTDA